MGKVNYKSYKIITLCTLAVALLWQSMLFAVGAPLFFRVIGKEQGLSQSSIIETFQSRDGYVWLATQDGLNRYDGYELRIFKNEPDNPQSISDNFIWSIAEDRQGHLWIGTAGGGVNRYDPKTETFTRFRNVPNDISSLSGDEVQDILVDSRDRVWLATANSGLNLFQPQKNSFQRFQNSTSSPNVLNSNTVKVIKEAADGKLWLGYSHAPFLRFPGAGFSLFDPNTGSNTAFTTNEGLSHNNVTDILPTDDNKIWISTYRGGLNLFDLQTREIKPIPLPSEQKQIRLLNMAIGPTGNLWLSQMGGGLFELDTKTLDAFLHRPNQTESLTLNRNSVSNVYIRNEILWVGTWQEGLNISNLRGRQFGKLLKGFYQKNGLSESSVTYISRSKKTGHVWLANSSALLQYDSHFNLLRRYLVSDLLPDLKDKTIRFVFADSSGYIWFNSQQLGMFRFTPPENYSDALIQVKDYRSIINTDRTYAMAELAPGRFAIGTRNKGIFLFDTDDNRMVELKAETSDQETSANNSAIAKNGIVADSIAGGWWVATNGGGINFLSSQEKLFLLGDLNSKINEDIIHTLLPVGNDTLWVGTQGNGLFRLRWKNTRNIVEQPDIEIFTEADGLASSTVGALAADGDDLWISTTQGVSLYESTTNQFHNYDIHNGVLPEYNVGVGEKLDRNTIIFGGFKGATFFSPKDLKLTRPASKMVINQLLIESKDVPISSDHEVSPLQQYQVQYTDKLQFHYTLSHFTLGFGALEYVKPRAIEYAFRLSGFDSEWQYINSSRRFATYTNLDAGNYEFELKSTNSFGQWNGQVVNLPIRIEPAPWKTWWAFLGYALTIFLIGSNFILQRLNRIRAIKERNEQLSVTSKLFENTSEGVILFDHSNRVALINDGYTKITGHEPSEVLGSKINLPLVNEQKVGLFDEILSKVTQGDKWHGELWAQRKSGDIFPVEIVIDKIESASQGQGEPHSSGRFMHVAILSDITQRKKNEQKLRELAFYDELTLLPNRSSFERKVESEIENSSSSNLLPFAVMFVDLDNFKSINDSLGHTIGDKFLQKLAKRLRIAVEHRITIARLGGDEFLILIPSELIDEDGSEDNLSEKGCTEKSRSETDEAEGSHLEKNCSKERLNDKDLLRKIVTNIASGIFEIVMQPVEVDEYKLRATCSIGIAIYPDHGLTFERLMRNADTAMYEAKKNKSQSIRCYNKRMNVLAREQFEIAEEIREDVRSHCFLPYYQAKADTNTGKIFGIEVLTRWNNQKLGWISPAQFIPIAEERGLINALSEKIVETACQEILPLIKQGKFVGRMAINLSPVQFQQVDVVDRLFAIVERNNFPVENLEIEVTESIAILDRGQALAHITKIRDLGAHVSLDDFGTGYSSLSYLHSFPLDTVKIDRSFVSELMTNTDNQKITSAIINMSHSLGMSVIAEGVENVQQLQFLKDSDCDYIQGYYFHKPCDIETLTSFLDSDPSLF